MRERPSSPRVRRLALAIGGARASKGCRITRGACATDRGICHEAPWRGPPQVSRKRVFQAGVELAWPSGWTSGRSATRSRRRPGHHSPTRRALVAARAAGRRHASGSAQKKHPRRGRPTARETGAAVDGQRGSRRAAACERERGVSRPHATRPSPPSLLLRERSHAIERDRCAHECAIERQGRIKNNKARRAGVYDEVAARLERSARRQPCGPGKSQYGFIEVGGGTCQKARGRSLVRRRSRFDVHVPPRGRARDRG